MKPLTHDMSRREACAVRTPLGPVLLSVFFG